jgi:hypothetical protein
MAAKWARVRFFDRSGVPDYRCVKWPPLGPYWCSGYGDGYAIIVAYIPSQEIMRITEFWPDAFDIEELEESDTIEFSSRFQCPEYWDSAKEEVKDEKG